ncbi:hypothetical protein Q4595_20600, partial [Wenyingzhuangia sp. 1_MG-2023]|nr:hypothetical protein [Wenyingzhuangia sp. 1_MG-2023]
MKMATSALPDAVPNQPELNREPAMILNTPNRYGLVAIALHWLMALGVIGMFGLGLYMVELTYYD